MTELPASAYPKCANCGDPITRPDSRLVLHEVTGFTRARDAGGANHIVARRETGRLICADCGVSLQRTGSLDQGRLV
jgi:ribosomal protein L34E